MRALAIAALGLTLATSPAGACDEHGSEKIARSICSASGGTWLAGVCVNLDR